MVNNEEKREIFFCILLPQKKLERYGSEMSGRDPRILIRTKPLRIRNADYSNVSNWFQYGSGYSILPQYRSGYRKLNYCLFIYQDYLFIVNFLPTRSRRTKSMQIHVDPDLKCCFTVDYIKKSFF
jgi:hypothetical protein